ncbi:MAG: hypothetical protein ACYCSS_01290 [Sulfuriferula sp.]
MGFVNSLAKIAAGAAAGVAVITALPIFGAVGAITATGAIVGAVMGGAAGLADAVKNSKKE